MQNLLINSWIQDLNNDAKINVKFGSAISHDGKLDHSVKLMKLSFVSFHELIAFSASFLNDAFLFFRIQTLGEGI